MKRRKGSHMKIMKRAAFQNLGGWIKGSEQFDEDRTISFLAKVFEERSEFGIDQGRISKLEIRVDDDVVARYERGWDIEPGEEILPFYEQFLRDYN
jgi:hypothetical protein